MVSTYFAKIYGFQKNLWQQISYITIHLFDVNKTMSEKDITIKQKQAKKTKAVVAKKKNNTKPSRKRTVKQEVNDADEVSNAPQTKTIIEKNKKRKLNLERLDLIAKKMQEIRKKSMKSKV